MTFKFGKEELKEFEEILSYAKIIKTYLNQDTINNLATDCGPVFEAKTKMAELFKDFDPAQEEDWKTFANNLKKMFLAIETHGGFEKYQVKDASLPFITKFVEETFFNCGSNAPLSYFMEANREPQTPNSVNSEVGHTIHVPLNPSYRPAVSSQLKKIEEETRALLKRINKLYDIGVINLLEDIQAVTLGSFAEHSEKVNFNDALEIKEISIVGKGRKLN